VSDGAAGARHCRPFYLEDVERHYQGLLDYQKPELQCDEWNDAEALSQVAG